MKEEIDYSLQNFLHEHGLWPEKLILPLDEFQEFAKELKESGDSFYYEGVLVSFDIDFDVWLLVAPEYN